MAVVIEHPTGVVYGHQCGGTGCYQRFVEGYLVQVGGPRFEVDKGQLSSAALTAVFHNGRRCSYGWGFRPPEDRLTELAARIEEIPYWYHSDLDNYIREPARLDETRLAEICEAWVPVLTPEGKGVLVWANCD